MVMKLFFAQEDAAYGILVGLFIIGLSGRFYDISKIANIKIIPIALFALSLFLTGLDIAHNITNLFGVHIIATSLLFINNLIDAAIEVGFLSLYTSIKVPVISNYLSYLQDPVALFYIGVFFVVTNIIWILVYPMIQ